MIDSSVCRVPGGDNLIKNRLNRVNRKGVDNKLLILI